jgi:hypothetical protein
MRARSTLIILLLVAGGSAFAGAPAHLDYDAGARGVFQRMKGKKVREGSSTYHYRPTPGGLQLAETETVANKNNRVVTTRTTLRPLEERMTVAEAQLVMGGHRERGYLYDVQKGGVKTLQLRAEMVETAYTGAPVGIGSFVERRYQLKDGVIESWTNDQGTTWRTPWSASSEPFGD